MPEIAASSHLAPAVAIRPASGGAVETIPVQPTVQLMAAMNTSAATWRDFADASHMVAGERRDIATLLRRGTDHVPNGLDGARVLRDHMHDMSLTLDAATAAREDLRTASDAFTGAAAIAAPGSSSLVSNRMRDAAATMLPDLGSFRHLTRHDIDGEGVFVSGLLSSVVGIPGGVVTAAQLVGTLGTLPDLLIGIGGPIATIGGGLLIGSQLMMRSGGARKVDTSTIVQTLDRQVSAAVDGATPQDHLDFGGRYATLPTRTAVGRLRDIDRRAASIAEQTTRQAADLGELVRSIQTDASVRAQDAAAAAQREQTVAARLAERRATNLADWSRVLDPDASAPQGS